MDVQLHANGAPAAAPFVEEAFYPHMEEPGTPIDIRRFVVAVLRYKWLVLIALVIGSAGAYYVWSSTEVTYTAEGNLWIEVDAGGAVGPIRAGGLLESNAWIELLRSYQVLDTVAVRERLFLEVPAEFAPVFQRFELDDPFLPGSYVLRVGTTGEDFVLSTADGTLVQQDGFGVPVGADVGFVWTPSMGAFEPEAEVRFRVLTARDAARTLSDQLITGMDRTGNFLSLSLSGTNPEKIASILNSVMERHVDVAAELKRAKLVEVLATLEDQLEKVELDLAEAERNLEEFRIATISLPSDRSSPIAPGLQITNDPFMANFTQMRVQLDALRSDRQRLQTLADEFGRGPVRIEALEVIPSASNSSELRILLDDLVEARSELRVLQDRYSDDYPPIQDLMTTISSLETGAIPRVVNGILATLGTQIGDLEGRLSATEAEMEEIPTRTIEEGRLERRLASVETLFNELKGRVEAADLAARSAIPDVRVLDAATVPSRPSEDSRLPLAVVILFGCVGAAVGGAILLDRMDARFRYAADVSRDIGLDILGSIPRIQSGGGRRGVVNAAQALEAFRELRIHVGFAYGSAGPITLAITSPSESEGKSLIASNLAVAFSEVGKRTLLIDGDTRRGDAHRLLGRERSPGLIDYLRERTGDDIIQPTDHPNLEFIGSGSRGVSTPELLASPRMAYFIGTLKRTYDVIIVDSPPLASGGDPLILGSLTGNLAVVIRTGSTERALAQNKLDQLSRLPIRILGAILNDVSEQDSRHSYYASYLPSYEPVPEDGDEDATPLLGEVTADVD